MEVSIFKSISEQLTRYRIRPFVIAVASVSIALFGTLFLQHITDYPFVFLFFGAVMCSAWFGGLLCGFLSVLLSGAALGYFFMPPSFSIAVSEVARTYLAAFIVCAAIMSWLSSARKQSEDALREARDKLEERVRERTAEIQRSQQALAQAQLELSNLSRTFSLGEFAASIAHELNQPLTAVVTHAYACREWLATEPANLERASATAEKIVLESTRASQIIARVRALFRRGEQQKQWVDINNVVKDLMRLLQDEATLRKVVVHTQFAAHLPRVEADALQIQQVLLNLATNGMDAMVEATPRELWIGTSCVDGKEVLVSVEDSGEGVDAEMASKAFQPFFTTKPHGVGLGLAISRSIVESHGGQLWMAPRGEGGTIVQFTIPVTA